MMIIIFRQVKTHMPVPVDDVLWFVKLNGTSMRYCLAIFLVLLVSCSPAVKVYHDYDRQVDLSVYKSYEWKMFDKTESAQNPLYDNELNDKRIKAAVNKAMMSKGYLQVDGSAELLIHYHIVIEDKSVVIRESDLHNYSSYWLGLDMNAYQYKEGSLIIDLMDARNSELVWRGWAVAILDDLDAKNIEKEMDRTIERIFEGLPVSAGK